ncbi:MAG: MBOAT family O-acyltransferase [Desulfovibrionaceae bacterium]
MLFNSFEYIVFFLIILVVFWVLRKKANLRVLFLLAASLYFYASNNSWFILLIILSTLIDYTAGLQISTSSSPRIKKYWLVGSLFANLSILAYFKYCNFFIDSFSAGLAYLGISISPHNMDIFLPVGISFYTFQSMSYTIDVYRATIPAERSLVRFACYIAFFPQLVAGPIVRASELLPQFSRPPQLSTTEMDQALYRIFLGLTKKIIFADFLAQFVDGPFTHPAGASGFEAWIALFAFTFQIYFDFSGYTDIAIGSARLLGFQLPENFNAPYVAHSFSDFWRRWHMTLSSWFRDYIYIPLGGNRHNVYINLFATLSLCGLWHGAAWTFVLWGAVHGVLLCLERALGWNRRSGLARQLWMFPLIALSWIPFRAESLPAAQAFLAALLRPTLPPVISLGMVASLCLVVGAWILQLLGERLKIDLWFLELPLPVRGLVFGALWSLIVVFNSSGETPFIYFQF